MYTKEELSEFALYVKKSTPDKRLAIMAILFVSGNEERFQRMYEYMKNKPDATFNKIQYMESLVVFEECLKDQGEKLL